MSIAVHPLLITLHNLRDTVYTLAREWSSAVEEVEDPDEQDALNIALADGYPLGRDLDELAAELDTYAEHVEKILANRPTALQLFAAEIKADVERVTDELSGQGRTTDDAYRARLNGRGPGGQTGRLGEILTPGVASWLANLLLAVDGGDPEMIQQAAERAGRCYSTSRRTQLLASPTPAGDRP